MRQDDHLMPIERELLTLGWTRQDHNERWDDARPGITPPIYENDKPIRSDGWYVDITSRLRGLCIEHSLAIARRRLAAQRLDRLGITRELAQRTNRRRGSKKS